MVTRLDMGGPVHRVVTYHHGRKFSSRKEAEQKRHIVQAVSGGSMRFFGFDRREDADEFATDIPRALRTETGKVWTATVIK